MAGREVFAQIFLYAIIILVGISVGGNVYEMLVIDPLWSASPPESVRTFFQGTGFARAMQKFWLSKLAKYSLFVLIGAVILGWDAPARRLWLSLAIIFTAATYALTLGYIFRRKKALFGKSGDLAAEAVVQMTRQFLVADRIRLFFKICTLLVLLRALSVGSGLF
jgi:hypothetical protein